MSDTNEGLDHPECPICKRKEEIELAASSARQHKWVQRCAMVSECLNRLRIIPRVIVAGYGYLVWDVVQWFQLLENPATQHAALVTTVVGAAGLIFGFYMQGGITNKSDKGN
jgi:hypothetical protein